MYMRRVCEWLCEWMGVNVYVGADECADSVMERAKKEKKSWGGKKEKKKG